MIIKILPFPFQFRQIPRRAGLRRYVSRNLYENDLQRMQQRTTSEVMRLRGSTVEHPFATIKYRIFGHPLSLRRGLAGAQTEISLAISHRRDWDGGWQIFVQATITAKVSVSGLQLYGPMPLNSVELQLAPAAATEPFHLSFHSVMRPVRSIESNRLVPIVGSGRSI